MKESNRIFYMLLFIMSVPVVIGSVLHWLPLASFTFFCWWVCFFFFCF